MKEQARFDVFIVKIDGEVIESVAGERLTFEGAALRHHTVESRINERYRVASAPAGRYVKGDVIGYN